MAHNLKEALLEYEAPKRSSGRATITKNNYKEIIEQLQEEEKKSCGIMKHDAVIKFLRTWFEK